jgi:nitroreductase
MVRDLILKNRSYRRFYENKPVTEKTLRELVDLARLSPSAANRQPLKYFLSVTPKQNALIFSHLRWAGYLDNWKGPIKGEQPTGYIIILGDSRISENFGCDQGIAAQSILLGAVEVGLGGCILGAVDREGLRKALDLSEHLKILLVLALGYPKEKVVLEEVEEEGDIKYWRDENQVHHVPKRSLEQVIID